MLCPKCKGKSRVYDSRETEAVVRRRRECLECKRRWTTYEVSVDPAKLEEMLARWAGELGELRRKQKEQGSNGPTAEHT